MIEVAKNPFFWAVVSMFGILGATAAINTKYGKRYRGLGFTFAILFVIGKLILVLPIVPQPRLAPSLWLTIFAIILGLFSIVFLALGYRSQPLIFSKKSVKLVTSGVNGIVRHPFYLGELLFTASTSLFFYSIIGLSFLPIWWAAYILHIIHEEERMEMELGPYYLEYKRHTRGRIIPIPPFELNSSIAKYPFKNLAFKGGGIKGVAYLGAIRALEEYNLLSQIERLVGSSAGAITATILSFNLEYGQSSAIMDSLDYQMVPQLQNEIENGEPSWLPRFIGNKVNKITADMEGAQRLINSYGWFSSKYFYEWLKVVIAEQCEGNGKATFEDFKNYGFKDLYIIGTNVSKINIEVFSYETTPQVPVVDAVRISMSIPLYFETLQFNGETFGQGDFHVDGGVLFNYPLQLFDVPPYTEGNIWFNGGINWETLGFYLYAKRTPDESSPKVHSFRDYISRIYECYDMSYQISQIDNNQIDKQRTVKINTKNVHATDFDLKPGDEQYDSLLYEGYEATIKFLKEYQHPSIRTNW